MKEAIKRIEEQLYKKIFAPESEIQHFNLGFVFRIGILIVSYMFFNILFKKGFVLPANLYHESSILLALLKNHFTQSFGFITILLLSLLIYFRNRSFSPWNVFSKYKPIRFFVLFVATLIAWAYSTYDLNLYLNQTHLFDRIALLILIPLIWWRPIFVFPFIMLSYAIIGQFDILAGFSWAIPMLPIHLLTIFWLYFLMYVFTKNNRPSDFLFLVGCLLVAHYWNSGFLKLNTEWLLHDPLNFLLPATYANGWWSSLSVDEIGTFTEKLMPFNPFLRPLVILLEVGSIFFLFHRKLAIGFLTGFIGFHIGVMIYSGICFWVWILIDFSLVILLLQKNGFSKIFKFNKFQIALFILLILSSIKWNRGGILFWHDSPMNYTFKFEAHAEDGKTYPLPPNFFAPYDYQFTIGRIGHFDKNLLLPITWGGTSKNISKWFRETQPSNEEIFKYEKENGYSRYDENKKILFENFIQTYIQNWNKRLSKKIGLNAFQSPRYLWTFPKEAFPENPMRIIKVNILEVTTLYQAGQYSEIRRRPIQEITIDD